MPEFGNARPDLEALNDRITGHITFPGDDGWDPARQAFNLTVDQKPVAVAFPQSATDVVEMVNFARDRNLRIAPQCTGHNASGIASLENTLLLRTERMADLDIDGEARRARVDAGVRWGQVTGPASEIGLAPLSGSSPNVCAVGHTVGGGFGWLSRRYGFAANSVEAFDVVTASGDVLRATADSEPDLFWALRGGGGSFGVVIGMEFALYPVPSLYAGALFWPWERSAEILHNWLEWSATVPEEATSVGRIMQFPPFPHIPDSLRGRQFCIVEVAFLGPESDGAELIRPLTELGPEINTLATIPPVGLGDLHMDPPEPVPGAAGHRLVGDLPGDAIDVLVATAGPGSGSPLVSVELRHLGGALSRPQPHHGALSSFDATFSLFAVGIAPTPEMQARAQGAIAKVVDGFNPWHAGLYLNFTQRPTHAREFFGEDTAARLQQIRTKVDPAALFAAAHEIV
jgi:hypothetical protein